MSDVIGFEPFMFSGRYNYAIGVLRHFQLAAILQVGGDAGGAESVIADARLDAGRFRAALDHAVGVLLVHRFFGQEARFAGRRAEQVTVRVTGDAGRLDVLVQEVIEIVVTGNVMNRSSTKVASGLRVS